MNAVAVRGGENELATLLKVAEEKVNTSSEFEAHMTRFMELVAERLDRDLILLDAFHRQILDLNNRVSFLERGLVALDTHNG